MSQSVSKKRADEPIHERVEREKLFKEEQARILAQVKLVQIEGDSEPVAPRPRSSRRKRRASASHPARTSGGALRRSGGRASARTPARASARTPARASARTPARASARTPARTSARGAARSARQAGGHGGSGLAIGLIAAALVGLLLFALL